MGTCAGGILVRLANPYTVSCKRLQDMILEKNLSALRLVQSFWFIVFVKHSYVFTHPWLPNEYCTLAG